MALPKHIEAAAERAMVAAEALRVAERDREEAYEAASRFAFYAMLDALHENTPGPTVIEDHVAEEFARLHDVISDASARLLLARVKVAAS